MHLSTARLVLPVFAFLALVVEPLHAQEPPIVWGEIPREDLEFKNFPADTGATAVVLCDYGESFINNNLDLEFKRHLRVKILNSRGYEFGSQSVVIRRKNEAITDIEGVTYALSADGKIVENEMKKDGIFIEDVDGVRDRYKFTLPSLSPGCVFELRYKIRAEDIYWVRDWEFQTSEPVRWSEYRLRSPRQIAYSAVTQGYERFLVNENVEVVQNFSEQAYSYLGEHLVKCNQMRWVLKNAPAIREEPYMTTTDDYINKVDAQLVGYAFIGGGKKTFTTTWPTLIEELLEDSDFGEAISTPSAVKDRAKELTAGLHTSEEKIRAVYRWVSSSILWSGENRFLARQSVKDLLQSKKGNSADITFLVLSLLKAAGIEGTPVILSTRANGQIQRAYPLYSQFNYVIARVVAEGKTYLLDATDPLRPMECLPTKVLNVLGLVIQPKKEEWITVASPIYSEEQLSATLSFDEDGNLNGKATGILAGYAGVFARRDLKESTPATVAKSYLGTEAVGVSIDSASVTGKDSIDVPLLFSASVSGSAYAQVSGDLVYLNPHALVRMQESPLKNPSRKFPVDYSYLRKRTTTVTIDIPDGYEVRDTVSNKKIQLSSGEVVFSRISERSEHGITVTCTSAINRLQFNPQDYGKLRQYYAFIMGLQSEQLVLARKQPRAGSR